MSENDIIAKYVKERMPNILQTCDFAVFKFKEKLVDDVRKVFANIDFTEAKEAVERINKNAFDD